MASGILSFSSKVKFGINCVEPILGSPEQRKSKLVFNKFIFLWLKLYESKLSTPLTIKKTETVVSVFFVGDEGFEPPTLWV